MVNYVREADTIPATRIITIIIIINEVLPFSDSIKLYGFAKLAIRNHLSVVMVESGN